MKAPKKNRLEWAVFIISSLLVLFVCGYLVYSGISTDSSPPSVDVKIVSMTVQTGRYVVELELENKGDQTAENILVEIVLQQNNRELEKAEFQIAFLPRHSKRRAFVTFHNNPQTARVVPRVLGFEAP